MSAHCQHDCSAAPSTQPGYRRVLWIALVVNAIMFGIEVFASQSAQSVSLLADAIGFFADAGNYAISLAVLGMASVWLCTRNDAIGNVAMMLAALGVFGTGSRWPDLGIALVIASLAISASLSVLAQARRELSEHNSTSNQHQHHQPY